MVLVTDSKYRFQLLSFLWTLSTALGKPIQPGGNYRWSFLRGLRTILVQVMSGLPRRISIIQLLSHRRWGVPLIMSSLKSRTWELGLCSLYLGNLIFPTLCTPMFAIRLLKGVLLISATTLSISGAEIVAMCVMAYILLSSTLFLSM